VKQNDTRWSSVYEMAKRYFRIKNAIRTIPTMAAFLPTASQTLRLKEAMTHLSNFQSVTKQLQSTEMDILDSHVIFDSILESYPSMQRYLAKNANIIHSNYFDTADIKIMSKVESTLRLSEKKLMAPFLIHIAKDAAVIEDDKSEMSFMEKVDFKRGKTMELEDWPKSNYISLRFLLSTSYVVERLVSLAHLILTDQRKSMSPTVFEALLYLQKNRDYWSVLDVAAAM
jgi:hypothetical protein